MNAGSGTRHALGSLPLEAVPAPLVVTRVDGTIEAANAEAAALLGAGEELRGRSLGAFVDGGLEAVLAEIAGAEEGSTVERELPLRRASPPGRLMLAGRRVDDGREEAVVWALRDVDLQRAVEQELRRLAVELEARAERQTRELATERARLAAILDGMPAGVIVAEAPAGRIVLTNEQAERILLLRPIEAESLAAYGAQQGLDEQGRRLEPTDWPLARALIRGEPVRDERIRVQRPDGSWLPLEVNANPIRNGAGDVVAAVVVFRDMSERDRRERVEREFVTNAAHELQTPLASIVSAVEVLNTGAKDVPEDRDRFLGHIERESARLVRVVRSLLLLARAQLAHETLVTAPVRLRPLLDGIALGLRPRSGIEVVVRCPARLSLTTSADLLEQAVGNLAANSVRHTVEGRIVLSASRVAGGICVEVADTGTGIPPEEAERVFGRFARGPGRNPDGFGLGLAIVRESVAALGGTVSLTPRRGGGTVARIVLPETGTEAE